MAIYAEDTKVSVADSQGDIERLVLAAGAKHFFRGTDGIQSVIGFELRGRRVQFALTLPTAATVKKPRGSSASIERIVEKTTRARWRALYITIKAKLVSVESQIESFEESFLGQIMVPNSTGAERFAKVAIAAIQSAYTGGKLPPLLPGGSPQ